MLELSTRSGCHIVGLELLDLPLWYSEHVPRCRPGQRKEEGHLQEPLHWQSSRREFNRKIAQTFPTICSLQFSSVIVGASFQFIFNGKGTERLTGWGRRRTRDEDEDNAADALL